MDANEKQLEEALYFFLQEELHLNMKYAEELAKRFTPKFIKYLQGGNWAATQ